MPFTDWIRDLRRAARSLRRTPEFTLTSVAMLGLAIGALTAMFSVVDGVLLRPLPYAEPERLVHIAASVPGSEFPPEFGVAPEFQVHYRERSKLLVDISTYNSFTTTLRDGERVERLRVSIPTNSMYSTLGVAPVLGRLPVAADNNDAIVISDALWRSWFGRDPAVIGRTIEIFGKPLAVIGVMGPEFRFPVADTQLWVSNILDLSEIDNPGEYGVDLVARMAPGATPEQVADELTALSRELPQRFGGSPAYARAMARHRAIVRPLDTQLLGNVSASLWVLLAAAAMVLLIACANVGNLFLVRAAGRHQELAVRSALGAARTQLVRLQMAEATVVAALAAGVALLLAALVLPVFLSVAPAGVPRLDEVSMGASGIAFTATMALLVALLCGGLPALRSSAPDLTRIRDGGRGSTRARNWARNVLVVAQTALALVLLIGSGLLVRSAHELRQVDPGYDTRDVFTFQIAPERPQLDSAAAFARFNLEFLDRLAALPGVQSVGLVENVPLNEGTITRRLRTEGMGGGAGEGALLDYTFVAGDYFRTMGIEVRGGRIFNDDDHGSALGNVIVSAAAAERLWPGQDPLGKRLQRDDQAPWETVVGVVEDVRQNNFRDPPQPLVYFPMVDATPSGGTVISSPAYVIKTARAETIAADVRALVREVAPEAPMYRAYTLAGLAEDSMRQLTFTVMTLTATALLALILGAVGLYGVLSYIVGERTREIGVRMALGAHPNRVRSMVVAQGAQVVGAGVAIGVLAALALTQALGSLLYGVQPVDAAIFTTMSATMVAVGLLASYVPARRASNLDPIESLRRE